MQSVCNSVSRMQGLLENIFGERILKPKNDLKYQWTKGSLKLLLVLKILLLKSGLCESRKEPSKDRVSQIPCLQT